MVMNTSVTPRAAGLRFKFALTMLIGSLGAALAAGAAGAAGAATVDNDALSLVVRYDSQILTTDSGVQHLYRRILGAAEQVCPEENIRDLGANARVRACRAQAVAHAIQQIGNTRLATLYAASAKSG
jgi:UrcA family protein